MTQGQRDAFSAELNRLLPIEFHHGDCVGADADADAIVRTLLPVPRIVVHPSTIRNLRAGCVGDVEHEMKPPLDRNRDIVDACEVIIATPETSEEHLRSGTWSTVRYARKKGIRVVVLTP